MNLLLKAKRVKEVTRQQILDYPLPNWNDSYTVVPNQLIIDTCLEALYKEGLRVKDEFYKQSVGNKFVGGFIMDGYGGYNLEFAWKNSYDKTMSVGIGLGSQVFLCSNNCISAEHILRKVHRGEADKIVVIFIQESVKQLAETYDKMVTQFDAWKSNEISKRLYAETAGRLYLEDKIVSPRQLSIIRDEMEQESFHYGVENTVYNLYQACTHALKSEPAISFIQTHAKLHQFFTNNFN